VTVRKKHLERGAPGTLELARKEGYRRGLNTARTMLVKAKNYQSQKGEKLGDGDADLKGEHEHAASILHELCGRLTDLIKAAK
jgi:hypothetical protein